VLTSHVRVKNLGGAGEKVMGRRLYVGNLAWTVTDQDLQDAFAEAGKVDSAQVIIDRATNRSRGFGFVEMASDEAAEAAIKKLNGKDIKGRPIKVNEAQARNNDRRGASRERA
jgi:RNA recognition motif-containing protein